MKFGVLVFPGSNCDHDTYNVVSQKSAHSPSPCSGMTPHDLENCDAILVPGGFAYGDYLRTGAIARFSPVMQSVKRFAAARRPRARHLQWLPDSLRGRTFSPELCMRNAGLKYICKQVHLRTETTDTPFTQRAEQGRGAARSPSATWKAITSATKRRWPALEARRPHRLPLCNAAGEITPQANPNGSLDNIAGICNEGRNVLGMMPHPDRSSELLLGSADGFPIFESMIAQLGIAALSGASAGAAK